VGSWVYKIRHAKIRPRFSQQAIVASILCPQEHILGIDGKRTPFMGCMYVDPRLWKVGSGHEGKKGIDWHGNLCLLLSNFKIISA
jgi:hypothetical protein